MGPKRKSRGDGSDDDSDDDSDGTSNSDEDSDAEEKRKQLAKKKKAKKKRKKQQEKVAAPKEPVVAQHQGWPKVNRTELSSPPSSSSYVWNPKMMQ